MATAKYDRIDLRISPEDKKTLEMAASIKRVSLSSYILSSCLETAAEDLKKEQSVSLSRKDWDQLMGLLENPPEPTPALKRLFE